ncbi:hypothetical protein JNUCC76_06760 [Leuconostoc sp. JNUCC 76]
MKMNLSELKTETISEIEMWRDKAIHDDVYELPILRIWVLYETYYVDSFKLFVLNIEEKEVKNSITDVSNKRYLGKINFSDENQFYKLMKSRGQSFIDYFDLVDDKGDLLLEPNPYKEMKQLNNFSQVNDIKKIRNFIAHRSDESRKAYIKILDPKGIDFIEVDEYMRKKRSGSKLKKTYKTNFIFYVEIIIEMISFIAEKPIEYNVS